MKNEKRKVSEVKKRSLARIGSYEEADVWVKDNEYLISGHRIEHYGFRETFKSLFTWHNETLNIWSHLLPALIFCIVLVFLFITFYLKIKMTNINSQLLDEDPGYQQLLLNIEHFKKFDYP